MSYARIKMSWPKGAVEATLEDTPTARALVAALPVKATLESGAKQVVPPGTVCLWVEGSALALPWGRTPVSEGDESRLVTRCNVLGRIDGDPRRLASVRSGDAISVSLK